MKTLAVLILDTSRVTTSVKLDLVLYVKVLKCIMANEIEWKQDTSKLMFALIEIKFFWLNPSMKKRLAHPSAVTGTGCLCVFGRVYNSETSYF